MNRPLWYKLSRRSKFVALAILGFVLILIASLWNQQNSDRLYVAMLAPMSGISGNVGEEMVQGTQMYLDKINQEGGINGKTVKLLVFDDEYDLEVGREKAQEIADDQRIVLTLGPYTSSIAVEAGKIYEQASLPALTATAQSKAITTSNNAYFQASFTTDEEGILLANYLRTILKEDNVSIIFDGSDNYSNSLTTSFRNTFQGLDGQISNQWDLQQIAPNSFGSISDFWQLDGEEIGTIALFSVGPQTTEIIANLRRAGVDVPIIGGNTLADQAFVSQLRTFPEAQAQPGYFSDGLYTTSPLIYDVSNEGTQGFRDRFIERYQYRPTWIAAASYDGAKIAVEALKRANLDGETLVEKRQGVYRALSAMGSPEQGVQGLEGPLYFDRDRNTPSKINVGVYEQQNLISAPVQLQPIANRRSINNLEEKINDGQILRMGGKYAYVTNVVYTGIDINQVSALDLRDESYVVDFFLWFRHPGDQEVEEIEFLNSAEPIELGDPIYEAERDGMKVRAFRIKTTFEGNFNFQDYPFDTQKLTLEFRHNYLRRNNLIYVPDVTGMQNSDLAAIREKFQQSEALDPLANWSFKEAHFFESTDKDYSTLGNIEITDSVSGIYYSKFNSTIDIERQSFSFSINDLLPLACFIWILYIFLFFPFEEFSIESISGLLLGVVFFHVGLKAELPEGIGYIIALDVFFYVIYGLIAAQIVLVLAIVRLKDSPEWVKTLQKIVKSFRFFFPVYLIGAALFIGVSYNIIPAGTFAQQTPETPTVEISTTENSTAQLESATYLSLGSWNPQYAPALNKLFREFYKNQAEIRLTNTSTPYSEYGPVLRSQLQSEVAPDLVFVRPFSLDRGLFEQGYLEPLNDLSGIQQTYAPEILNAWQTQAGEIYALPVTATSLGVFYNVELFEQFNLDIPQTWEELLTTAQRLQEQNILPFANSVGNIAFYRDDYISTSLFPNFTGGREGRLAYQSGDRCFNDAGMVDTFQALADLKPYFEEGDRPYLASKQKFRNGEAAMWISGSWDIQLFVNQTLDFQWSAFALPSPQGQPTYMVLQPTMSIGINSNSPHKEEAKQFLQWLMTPEAANLIANNFLGNFVLHREKPDLNNPNAQQFFSLLDNKETDVYWTNPQLDEKIPQGNVLLKEAATRVLKGEMTPQEAANHIQDGLAEWYEPAQICQQ